MTVDQLNKLLPKNFYARIGDSILWTNQEAVPAFDIEDHDNSQFDIKVDNSDVGILGTDLRLTSKGCSIPYKVMMLVTKFANTPPKKRISKNPRKAFSKYFEWVCHNYIEDNKAAYPDFKCHIDIRDYYEDPYDYKIVVINGDQFRLNLNSGTYKHSCLNEKDYLPDYIDSRIRDYFAK